MSMEYSGLWADSSGTDGQMHAMSGPAATSTGGAGGGLATSTTTSGGGVDGSALIQSILDVFGLSMQEAELVLQALYVAGTVGVAAALYLGGGA